MKFGDQVVAFDFEGIPMVGNLSTGYAIGLTADGNEICHRLLIEEVPPEEIAAVDEMLFQHLGLGGFFETRKRDESLQSAYVHVTQRCNLECAGCYSLDEQRNAFQDAPFESMARVFSELGSHNVSQVVISGGEPFLRDDLPGLLAYAKLECGIPSIVVLSNGLCMTADQLKRVAPFVDRVSISFDGCSDDSVAYIRGKQRFSELVKAVEAVKAAGIPGHIIATIHAKNIDDIDDYLRIAEELNVTIGFSLLSCSCDDPALGHLVLDEKAQTNLGLAMLTAGKGGPLPVSDSPIGASLTVKQSCGAGFGIVSVGADGTVYPCHMLHRRELAMGNLFTDSLGNILTSESGDTFKSLSTEEFEDCAGCDYERLCGGGCRARSVFGSGNLTSKDAYCGMMKEFFRGYGTML
ncbi:MAG: radical SAM/SPASM domain-containing protein, partial [Raoultibacter sp.]